MLMLQTITRWRLVTRLLVLPQHGRNLSSVEETDSQQAPRMNDVDSGLKGDTGRAEWAIAGLGGNVDRALGTGSFRSVGQIQGGHAGVEARQMDLGMTALVADFSGWRVIAGIPASGGNNDLVGQGIRHRFRTIAPERCADQAESQQHREKRTEAETAEHGENSRHQRVHIYCCCCIMWSADSSLKCNCVMTRV